MAIIWDEEKAKRLFEERGIILKEIAALIEEDQFLGVLENPSRPTQQIFVIRYKGYVHGVPFVILPDGTTLLRTAYPSRKLNRNYADQKKNTAH